MKPKQSNLKAYMERKPKKNQKCVRCGVKYDQARFWQRFCSSDCRRLAWFESNFVRVEK